MIVSFSVDIDLYWAIIFGCFLRNALTSAYLTIPVDDTIKIQAIQNLYHKFIKKIQDDL